MSPSGRMTAPLLKDLFVLPQLTSSLQFFAAGSGLQN